MTTSIPTPQPAPTVSQGDARRLTSKQLADELIGVGAAIEDATAALRADLARVTAEAEQLRTQQAGVSVVAMGGTSEPQLVTRGMYGWSVAYDDVLALRLEFEAVEAEMDALAVKLGEARTLLRLAHFPFDSDCGRRDILVASIDNAGTAAKGTP